MNKKLISKAQTVLGLIDGDELGFVLPHEHLLLDLTARLWLPSEAMSVRAMASKPVCLENNGWIRYHAFENIDNLKLDDEEMMIKETSLYKRAGGQTIVDMTNWGLGRDPKAIARISRATGLNIIMGSGYYSSDTKRALEMKAKTEEGIAEDIIKDIMVGEDGICAGIIGEIGADSWPLVDEERKSLRAAARAQRATGAPVNIHNGRRIVGTSANIDTSRPEEPLLQVLQILDKAGADLSRVVMSHVDRTNYSFESILEMAKTGCYLEFDNFGRCEGISPRPFGALSSPNDCDRVDRIIRLIDKGYLNQILISHDVCLKMALISYGGVGYSHIIDNVIPWMRAMGIPEEAIHAITEENPKRLLLFVSPEAL